MILLPILYFLMIGGVGWGIWYHATHHTGIITSISDSTSRNSGRAYVVGILLYAAPMLAGATLLLFMLKPLFARPAEKPGTRTLKKSEEPLLFDFVSRICDSVNAPVPSRIAIDFEVNASASFNNGWKSFFNNDLVLTIGMPLAAGLTMRQFGGVLAHEFGHFAQGAGMRLTFIIRSINLWFARVVYERDEWDEWLKGLCETLDLRIGWMVYLARLCVWLSRRILWCLMMTGHFFSSLLMRQMEFDADRYEARFAGSETFKSTVRQLHVLNMANQGAISDLGDFYQEGRLGDNLPKLILINSDQISEKNRKIIDTMISESKTELFDTHPCDKARIANAEREECDGIFQLNLPASHLFMDFDARAKAVTWDFYKGIFGKKLKKSDIHPVDELLDRQKSQQETLKALARFFQGPIPLYRPIQGLETARKTNTDSGKEVANLKAARSQLIAMAPNFAKAWKKYDKLDTRKIEAELAEKMLEANLQVSEEDFSVPLTSKKEIAQARNKIEEQEAKILPQINAFESAVSIRLMTGLRLAQSAPLAGALAASGGTVGEIRELVSLLQKINGGIPDILELRNSKLAMERLFGALETNPSDEKLLKKIRKLVKDTHGSVNRVRSGYSDFLYPFDHAKKDLSVGMFLISDTPDVDNPLEVYEAVEGFVDKIGQLQARVLGRLCQIAEAMETHFQIPPLGDPPLEAESEAREEE